MTIYTITAYRPSTIDSRRDEYEHSEFEYRCYDNLEDALFSFHDYSIKNHRQTVGNGRYYSGYELEVFIDGRSNDYANDNDEKNTRYDFLFDEFKSIAKDRWDAFVDAEFRAALEVKKREDEIRAAEVKRKKIEALEAKRKLYEKLKKEFGDDPR